MTRARLTTHCAIVAFFSLSSASAVAAQGFGQLTAGWASVGPMASEGGETHAGGVAVGGSAGGTIAPRIRASVDLTGIRFDRNEQYYPPCPYPGCSHPYFTPVSSGMLAVSASGRVDLEPSGLLYAMAGLGEYATFLGSTEYHVGASAGAGVAVPIGPRARAVIEASWHRLLGRAEHPAQFLPINAGIRF